MHGVTMKKNIIHFLVDLESYFLLRGVANTFKLVLARSAVVDGYTSQWINTVYKDLTSYKKFREAIAEFSGGPQYKLDGDVPGIKACLL